MPIKEVRYWSDLPYRTVAWYADRLTTDVRIVGDMTPSYFCLSRPTIMAVRRVMPEVRLLLMLRDPVERAWSAFRRKRLPLGVPATVSEVSAFLARNPWPRGASIGRFEYGDYAASLENWLSVFPRDQLLGIPMWRIKSEPAAVVTSVLRHIGADINAATEIPGRINSNTAAAMPDSVRDFLERRYKGQREKVQNLLDVSW